MIGTPVTITVGLLVDPPGAAGERAEELGSNKGVYFDFDGDARTDAVAFSEVVEDAEDPRAEVRHVFTTPGINTVRITTTVHVEHPDVTVRATGELKITGAPALRASRPA
jgi:hypothetical protein